MRVAIVHDDLVQWGGAERVLEGLSEIYPDATIFTSVFDRGNKELLQRFGKRNVVTTFLQKIPGWRNFYKQLLPLYPIAFEQFNFDGFDLVISHTTRFAKAVITKPQTLHICFCHTPPRFLWHFPKKENFGLTEIIISKLRIFDQISARRVDLFLAGSENAKKRIKKIYRMDSKVVYPFIDLKRFESIETFDGNYFVVMGRPNKYKKFDLAIEVCKKMGVELKIISGNLDEETVVKILAGAKALIIPGIEDFGLTSLEAQALGKPVIAYKGGGVLETVIEGQSGLFFEEDLEKVIKDLDKYRWDQIKIKENAKRFSKENFHKSFKQAVLM